VYLDKKKIIKSDYPILGVSSLKETLAVEVIKDYRTPLLFYDINGDKIGETR